MNDSRINISEEKSTEHSYCDKSDVSFICGQLVDFERLRISALTKAAEISPLVKEATIGPNSPSKKENIYNNILHKDINNDHVKVIEPCLNKDLHITAMRKEYETNLQETSEIIFKSLIEKMVANRAEIMLKYWENQTKIYEHKTFELRARKLQMLKQLQENDNLSVLEHTQIYEQNQYINKKTIENMNRILEEQNQATSRFASITDSHTRIYVCFNDINVVLQSTEFQDSLSNKYSNLLHSILNNINNIMEYCKCGTITDKEVKQAEVLKVDIENIKNKIMQDLQKLTEQKLACEQERLKQEQEMLKQQQIKEENEKKAIQTNKTPLFYSVQNYKYYNDLMSHLTIFENTYKELAENANFKKFRFDCQKAVNTPVNSISSVSGIHMRDKFEKLSKLLKGESLQIADVIVCASQHAQGVAYCMAILAKKIVRQGDLLVSSNSEAAFPLATVTVALWSQFPELGKLIEANFQKECPYLVPMFLPQKEGQSDKDFYISRGYTYKEGVVEKQDKFLKRMSGVFKLMCAIWIAKNPSFLNTPNPHGLRYAWKWLASFVNLKPEPDISATLLHDFLTMCGSEFYKHYGKQFTKILKLISTEYLAKLEHIDEGGPKTRLEVFLHNVIKNGQIPPPKGLLSSNTW